MREAWYNVVLDTVISATINVIFTILGLALSLFMIVTPIYIFSNVPVQQSFECHRPQDGKAKLCRYSKNYFYDIREPQIFSYAESDVIGATWYENTHKTGTGSKYSSYDVLVVGHGALKGAPTLSYKKAAEASKVAKRIKNYFSDTSAKSLYIEQSQQPWLIALGFFVIFLGVYILCKMFIPVRNRTA